MTRQARKFVEQLKIMLTIKAFFTKSFHKFIETKRRVKNDICKILAGYFSSGLHTSRTFQLDEISEIFFFLASLAVALDLKLFLKMALLKKISFLASICISQTN